MRVVIEPTDHVLGPEHASVSVIEYGDFECPTCRVAVAPIKALLDAYPQRIRFVWRHFPMEEAHPHALIAAEAAESAGAQGQFWAMHDLLLEHQNHLDRAHLLKHAQQIGLDVARFTVDLNDQVYLQRVREHIAGGRAMHLRATPSFFVNGQLQDVSYGMKGLHDAVVAAVRA